MFKHLTPPSEGSIIKIVKGEVRAPKDPIIPFIEGDGIGPDIMRATRLVLDAAVAKAFGDKRKIHWLEIYAGEKANEKFGEWLPEDTFEAIRYYHVALKGPLTTPVGGGFRSLNVTLRQVLDLYACVRPVRYFEGVPSPVKHPEKLNVVIFRENTEDVYAGLEVQEGTAEAKKLISYLSRLFGTKIRKDSGIGIKPISITGSQRLVAMAIRYALSHGRKSVTLVHKGNIMKFTEGAFRDWGYQIAAKEYSNETVPESETWDAPDAAEGKVVIKDRIADSMFQQVLTRPSEYDVLAMPNLNGDYMSDACAAQVGGLGMAPGANIGDKNALFEATHGTAPKYANQDKVNPGSLILSGVMMLEHLGWQPAADLVVKGLQRTITQRRVTYDLARLVENATEVKCSQFAQAIVDNMV